MNSILAVGVLVIAGFFGGLVAKKIRYPRISGYIIVGMLLSPSVLNVIPSQLIREDLSVITDIALGVVAYLIGGSLSIERLKKLGKNIVTITPFEALGAWIFVTLLILSLGHFVIKFDISNPNFYQTYLPMAIIIGAISCPTAPAAIMAIIHEYRAKGPLTTTLLGVVALDDAFAIISFAIATSIGAVLIIGVKALSLYQMFIIPILDIAGSLLLGAGFGFALVYMSRFAKTRKTLLVTVLGMIMLSVGATKALGISSLLANMAVGFVVVNKMRSSEKMFTVINDIEDIVFAMFFTLAGAHFDLGVVKSAGILALLIVIGRFSGKFIGAKIGAVVSHAPAMIRKYLGFGLLPKAGVTIGLVLLVQQNSVFSVIKVIMVNAILASVIINELIAPPLTKYALFKAGEATSQ